MSTQPTLVILSGYFSPIHIGHLEMIEAGAALGDELFVIVNNNAQQVRKKGRVIIEETERLRIVKALRAVDHSMIAIDDDETVRASIALIAEQYTGRRIIFGNGGDRKPDNVPEHEVCERYGIEMVWGVGGDAKADSSSRLIDELGL